MKNSTHQNPDIYIFFGKSCAGKSYVAQKFSEHLGLPFVEGDTFATSAMERCIELNEPFTDEIRDEYYNILIEGIHRYIEHSDGLVLAQALFKSKHRNLLRKEFPTAKFIWIDTPQKLLFKQANNRLGHFIATKYVFMINALFEEPNEDEQYIRYVNDHVEVDFDFIANGFS